MSMISNAHITGGVFSQSIQVDQRIYTQKSPIDRLQESVAHTAFHNSGERFDPPKCHPNTRVAVLDEIEKWALRKDPDTGYASIMWLSGAAGAGKSAIAQTLAERFHSKGLLVASFFFGRSDSTRNHARSLVATIVYQLYASLPPPEQSRLSALIDRDPLIFTKSLLAQFEALVVNPLQSLFDSGLWISTGAPRLIIIDGLDECLDHGMQREVLLLLSASIRQFRAPFVFLLASRPEHDIQATFGSPDFLPIHTRLFLDDTYFPERDIEFFLRDQFEECRTSHPFRHMIPPNWPSDDMVYQLTRKSSGQFIYASVVAKYVKSSRHRPHHRLDVVLNLRPASRDLPFSELDALYTHIFSRVDVNDIQRVLDVISFAIVFQTWNPSVDDIERILQLDEGEVAILLCDLASVIGYENTSYLRLKIHHASLADYLLDSARSKEYFIDANVQRHDHLIYTVPSAMTCFETVHHSLDLTESLYDAIRGFSIPRIYNLAQNLALITRANIRFVLRLLILDFLPALFKFLKKIGTCFMRHSSLEMADILILKFKDSAKCLELCQYHQSEYDHLLREIIKISPPQGPDLLALALVTIHRKLPIRAFHPSLSLFRLHNRHPFQLGSIGGIGLGHVEYLSDFLRDSKRSQELCAGPRLFAEAAKVCLSYLCNHTAFAQKTPPRMSAQQRRSRKHTPWKWHKRIPRDHIRGPSDTPWLWLRRPNPNGDIVGTCVLHRKTNDRIYIHTPNVNLSLSEPYDPVVMYRINSEKYYLALIYLNHFLPRAAKLDSLVYMCRGLTFASRCQDFPRQSARARSNMQQYTAKWR